MYVHQSKLNFIIDLEFENGQIYAMTFLHEGSNMNEGKLLHEE